MSNVEKFFRSLGSVACTILCDVIGWTGIAFVMGAGFLDGLSKILDPWSLRNTTVDESESREE